MNNLARTAQAGSRSATEVEPTIRPVRPSDRSHLVDIWLRSVRSTHAFLTPADIDGLIEPTTAYLMSDESELWALTDAFDRPIGFMGLGGNEVESLFLAPEAQRRGAGRRLIEMAARLLGELTVVVNEQNAGAVRFYEACGFVTERRAEVDDDGRPFPILFMRRPEQPGTVAGDPAQQDRTGSP